jgi:hypothetical protein
MAADSKVRAIDIGQGWWQDIDTFDMLWHAEAKMRALATKENQVEPASYRAGS